MRRLFRYLRGYSEIEISGAAPTWALNRLMKEKLAFWNICWADPLTVRLCVYRGKESAAGLAAEAAMCDCKVLTTRGIFQPIGTVFHRPVLAIMLLLSFLSILVLPCFLFFFEVEGNEAIPKQRILQELEKAGVHFGIYGPKIYPRRVKDLMIEELPQLQWVTVEQNGCRGKVVVREREEKLDTENKKGFANVIATQGGIITEQSVYAGQAQFQVGDTVSKGEILVSGIVDLERTYLIERANAEIFARTWRRMQACTPISYTGKRYNDSERRCVWLILGKRRIKLSGNSGISYASCDKMIERKTLTLPRGLSLPVTLEIETFSFYDESERELQENVAEGFLKSYVISFTEDQMKAGEMLHQTFELSQQDGCYCLEAELECHEMIAEVSEAKWNNEDFLND